MRNFLPAIALAALVGCTGPTPYLPAADRYGYTDARIEENHFRVAFSGNYATPRSTVENHLLRRAAEVTLESGHNWFVMTDSDLERSVTWQMLGDPWYRSPWHFRSRHLWHKGFRSRFRAPSAYHARPIDRWDAYATIAVFRGEKPSDDADAYDARDVLSRLATQAAEAGDGRSGS